MPLKLTQHQIQITMSKKDIIIQRKESKLAMPYPVKANTDSTKDVDLGERVVSGLYNTYFYIDSDYDMLLPGCAAKSIAEHGPNSGNKARKIRHLKDHNVRENIARINVLEEKEVEFNGQVLTGIYHESFYPTSTDSNDMLLKIHAKVYNERSIGFRYMDLDMCSKDSPNEEYRRNWNKYYPMALNPEKADELGMFWIVKEIMLFEGSDVAFGANELTPTLGTKSIEEKNAHALTLVNRLKNMENLYKNGSLTDKGFQEMELEMLQIQQSILNLSQLEPSIKHTIPSKEALRGRENKDTQETNDDSNDNGHIDEIESVIY